jgi:uncharacterized membrane protein (TIGR02234 family)
MTQRVTLLATFVAGLFLTMAGRLPWAHVAYPLHPRAVYGRTYASAAVAVGLIAIAGGVAVLATRRYARIPVGLAIAAAGATVAAQAFDALRHLDNRAYRAAPLVLSGAVAPIGYAVRATPWPYVTLLCGLVVAAAGVVVVLRGPRWSAMGSRYDAPAARPVTEADLWSALDRGEDPTA